MDSTNSTTSTNATTSVASAGTSPPEEGVEDIGALDDGVVVAGAGRSPGYTVEGGDGATMGRLPPAQRPAASTFSSIEEARTKLARDFGVVVV
ncbi:MAG TPA: hypothetical protein VGF99_08215, partial [Myxococcota bacterium]